MCTINKKKAKNYNLPLQRDRNYILCVHDNKSQNILYIGYWIFNDNFRNMLKKNSVKNWREKKDSIYNYNFEILFLFSSNGVNRVYLPTYIDLIKKKCF